MIACGARERRAVHADKTPGGHVGNDQERGVTKLRVFERQFLIDQFLM